MKTGSELIADERARQLSVKGWTPEHDDKHTHGVLIHAAQAYTMMADAQVKGIDTPPCFIPRFWPWGRQWWKPSNDPVRNLVKAGALIAAEIDRLQRTATVAASPNTKISLAEAITAADAELIRDILQRWNNLSNLGEGDPGYHSMTDHCHDLYDRGWALADTLEKIAKVSSPNTELTNGGLPPLGRAPGSPPFLWTDNTSETQRTPSRRSYRTIPASSCLPSLSTARATTASPTSLTRNAPMRSTQ
jgi:hypothetical protein